MSMTHRFGWLCIAVGASGLLMGETPSSSLKASLQVERKAAAGAPQVPVLGFVARSSPVGLQPVLGTSGAVVLGDLIVANDDVTRIVVAPGQQYALAERANSAELGWISLDKGVASDLRLLSGAMSHWDRL